jgi:FkbM family methyltransferase
MAPFAPVRVTLKSAFRRLKAALGLDVYRRPEVSVETVRLGDPGGRWGIAPGVLGAGTVYAFGVGTDISFERDLLARCGVTVHAFDPTPIALEWAAAQQLPERFVLHPYGVADFDGTARFAAPRKRKFASFSMVRQEGVGPAVEAPVHRLTHLIDMLRLPPPDVLKLDIEGTEYAVLADLLAGPIRPAQILVEFHHRWREVGVRRTRQALRLLAGGGYRIADVSENGMEYVFLHRA